ncbi:uncharacterized protein LOC110645492 isoform X1 [Hevea brasiliensis]|uniref:uncharacterized protein LOC110645492 isoform X1 n=1 Tax=Hevea brasiliensis TaxID=3981 RepID=UPI0025E8AD93|nr:uncharacterized protein LOC110645492 isoform X1 [Hevea brasiliensis]
MGPISGRSGIQRHRRWICLSKELYPIGLKKRRLIILPGNLCAHVPFYEGKYVDIWGNALGTVIVFFEHPMLDVAVFLCTTTRLSKSVDVFIFPPSLFLGLFFQDLKCFAAVTESCIAPLM